MPERPLNPKTETKVGRRAEDDNILPPRRMLIIVNGFYRVNCNLTNNEVYRSKF